MVSTDKACSPTNVYGMCKALAEKMTIEKSLRYPNIKWNITRYGNVLNSNGSIIPYLHKVGKSANDYTLTDSRMTRFIMTLSESVDLIDHAITTSPSGTITIPSLSAMRIEDLFTLFSQKYNKNINIIGIKKGEKINEDLINEMEGLLTRHSNNYLLVFPTQELYDESQDLEKYEFKGYDSSMRLLTINELEKELKGINLY